MVVSDRVVSSSVRQRSHLGDRRSVDLDEPGQAITRARLRAEERLVARSRGQRLLDGVTSSTQSRPAQKAFLGTANATVPLRRQQRTDFEKTPRSTWYHRGSRPKT